jgi:hypothetical protein
LGCHLLRFVLSFGELMSRGEKARRNFRQLERVVSQPYAHLDFETIQQVTN